jgi:hypothetical protein
MEEKWRERGGVDPDSAMEKRGGERKGGVWRGRRDAEEGGGGAGDRQGTWPVEAGASRRRASRGREGGARGSCVKVQGGQGKEGAGPARKQQCRFLI